jgi:hypothetical protein
LTKEQYSSEYRSTPSILNVSRDRLNPELNLSLLQRRLHTIEAYKLQRGVEFMHWPHFAMNRLGRHLFRYKFNYALKGFFFALIVNDWRQWNHAASQRFLTKQEDAMRAGQMGIHTAGFVALCLLI